MSDETDEAKTLKSLKAKYREEKVYFFDTDEIFADDRQRLTLLLCYLKTRTEKQSGLVGPTATMY